MRLRVIAPFFLIGGLAWLALFFYPRPHVSEDSVGPDAAWHPTAEEIARAIGTGQPGKFNDVRHRKFEEMFKDRYRAQQHAIGIRFMSDSLIKAMFAPIIPRWDMARVSVELEHESREIFGRHYDVN